MKTQTPNADRSGRAVVEVVDGPIDLAATLDGGQAFRWWPDDAEGQGSYRGVILDRVVRISPSGNDLVVTALDDKPVDQAAGLVSDHVNASATLAAFRRKFGSEPGVCGAILDYPGLRLLRQDPWECLACYLCSSTSSVKRIKQNAEDLAVTLGRKVGPGKGDFEFPSAQAVADAGEQKLRDLKLGFHAKGLAKAAALVAAGDLDLSSLRTLAYDEAKRELLKLEGVGDKIADCVLAFSLDKPQTFPLDTWVRQAVRKRYTLPDRCDDAFIREWAREKFGDFSAIASQFLFYREWVTRGTAG